MIAVIEFVSGFALASLIFAVVHRCRKKRYHLFMSKLQQAAADWQRVELPPVDRPADGKDGSKLSEAVWQLMNRLRLLSQEIQLTSQQVRAASDQMDISVRSTTDIFQAFQQIRGIATTLQNAGERLENDFLESERAIQDSVQAIQSVNDTIEDIQSGNSQLNEQITTLKEAVEQVRFISQNIGEISQQTKLLALNAAIEAARAGEQGRGFGVVAQEIGKLSDLTAGAVKQTSEVLEQIKQDVATVVSSINASLNSSRAAATQLYNIQTVFNQSFDFVHKVNNTARETLYDVNGSLQQVASVLESRNRDLESVVSTGMLLANLATDLEKVVENSQLSYVVQKKALSRIDQIKSLLTQAAQNSGIIQMDRPRHENILLQLKETNPDIEAIWSNDSEGAFLFSQPAAGLANARVREWWQRAAAGEIYISPVYISAITRQPCLTVSVPVSRGGQVIGVLGADVGLS